MRALLTDGAAAVDDIQNFESFLSNLRPHPMRFVAERSGFLFLVGPPVDQTVDRNIIDEGARRGVRILGIGTASADSKTHDLATAAEQAALAAQFASSIREFFPSVDISRLGGWVLLRNANLDPSWLSVISPAAATLASAGYETQRRTVEAYLDAGGQVSIACRQLFIHRTTLYYRLERLPLNVRDALADGMQRSALHLALKLVGLWEASGRV